MRNGGRFSLSKEKKEGKKNTAKTVPCEVVQKKRKIKKHGKASHAQEVGGTFGKAWEKATKKQS